MGIPNFIDAADPIEREGFEIIEQIQRNTAARLRVAATISVTVTPRARRRRMAELERLTVESEALIARLHQLAAARDHAAGTA
jgi:hypothetical protein